MPDINSKIALAPDAMLLESETSEILKLIEARRHESTHPVLVSGLCEGARAVFYAAVIGKLRDRYHVPALILVPDEKEGLKLYNALSELSLKPLNYPLRDLVFHNIVASR